MVFLGQKIKKHSLKWGKGNRIVTFLCKTQWKVWKNRNISY